ncbi:MAG: autotransporter assembly complex family protein [Pseudomonadota bacterium]
MVNLVCGQRRQYRTLVIGLCFICAAGSGALALDVSVRGAVDEDFRQEIESGSLLFAQSQQETQPSTQELVGIARADYERLLSVLYEAGYFSAVISIEVDGREAADLSPVAPPSSIRQAVITVTPGRLFTFGKVGVEPLAPDTELPQGFRLDAPANLSILRATATSAVNGWRNFGHAKAQVSGQTVTARHSELRIDANIVVEPGPKLRFGPVTFQGETAVRPERLQEISALPVGETYSPKELRDATQRLQRTGAFRSVALIEAETPNPDGTLPFSGRIVDAKPRRIGFGAELSTVEGLTIRSYWQHRNFFGGAETLRFDAEVSGLGGDTGGTDYTVGVRYERPATFNEDTGLYGEAEFEQLDEPDFFVRQVNLEVGIDRYISDQISYSLGVGLNRAETRDAFGEDEYTLLLFPASATFDYRDFEFDARSGYFAEAEVSPFLALAGADNGILSTLDLRGYRSFGRENPTTLAVRGQVGSLFGPELSDSPADFLFYSGGGDTVRGHSYQSLGITLPSGEQVGGRSFLGLSAELRFRTSGSLGFVGFVDAGYIGEESFPDGSGEWHSGAGIGVRYATPVGPIRFDVAVPTSGEDDDESAFQVYIGIGQSF